MVDNGKFDRSITPVPNDFLGDNFKSVIATDGTHDPMIEFTVNLGQSRTVVSAFLVNSAWL